MKNDCLICQRIHLSLQKKNSYFVCELETGIVVVEDNQFQKGYTIFLCKQHKTELHQLDDKFRKKYLEEMCIVSEAVFKAFKPKKINYELLGNSYPHLHWHIIPRYEDDLIPTKPIWVLEEKIRKKLRDKLYIQDIKQQLLEELKL